MCNTLTACVPRPRLTGLLGHGAVRCREGNLECVQMLLAAGAALELKTTLGDSALIKASALGHRHVVSVLMEQVGLYQAL